MTMESISVQLGAGNNDKIVYKVYRIRVISLFVEQASILLLRSGSNIT